MSRFILVGQLFVGVALLVFGIQQIVYLDFVTRVFPVLPAFVPAKPLFAGIFGLFLCVTGAAILGRFHARQFALVLAAMILVMFSLFLLPSLMMNLSNGFIWTNSGKALVLAGATLITAQSFQAPKTSSTFNLLEKLLPLGVIFLSGFFILAAVLHFVYADFVAMLVPAWIPYHLFWTYFAAVALIAGAIGMLVPKTSRLAAGLSALMIFLWIILLHIPRALANLHDANETTALFEACAMCGAALLVAARSKI